MRYKLPLSTMLLCLTVCSAVHSSGFEETLVLNEVEVQNINELRVRINLIDQNIEELRKALNGHSNKNDTETLAYISGTAIEIQNLYNDLRLPNEQHDFIEDIRQRADDLYDKVFRVDYSGLIPWDELTNTGTDPEGIHAAPIRPYNEETQELLNYVPQLSDLLNTINKKLNE